MRFIKYFALIGIGLFLYILYSIGPSVIAENLAKADPFLFAAAIALIGPPVLLKGWKQQIIVAALGRKFSLAQNTKIWLAGFFWGSITPGKAGDFLRAAYLRSSANLQLGRGLAATAVERVFDLLFLFFAALIGLAFFSLQYSAASGLIPLLLVLLALFALGLVVLANKRLTAFILRPFFNFLLPFKAKQKFKTAFHEFYDAVRALARKRETVVVLVFLTAASWLLAILQFYFVALSLRLPVSFEFVAAIMPAILLIEILPISFAGIGTRDAAAIFFLSFAGIGAGQAVSFTITIFFMNMLIAFIGMLAAFGFKEAWATK